MQHFEKRCLIEAPAEAVYEWHVRPGAFSRLQPPWENVNILGEEAAIREGEEMTMRIKLAGPISKDWLAHIKRVEPGVEFQDVQLKGPFAHWEHTHTILKRTADICELVDSIQYEVPLGGLGRLAAGRAVRKQLERMFEFRHQQTIGDILTHRLYSEGNTMKVAVTGSSGLVGSQLGSFLTTGGHEVFPVVRKPSGSRQEITWDIQKQQIDKNRFEGLDAVVHLAGENIAAGRWTEKLKQRIRDSRVQGTKLLAESLASLQNPPKVLVCASAIGYYGDRGEEELDESAPPGKSFLADVCQEWEASADAARAKGIRVVHLRLGVVLSPQGGALKAMLTPFKLGAGGVIGGGQQYWSWVALNDVIGAIYHSLMTESLVGPVNCVAPQPVTNREFTKTLGKVLHRPTIFPMPGFAAKMVLGEMAEELLLSSSKVIPKRLLETDYRFRHPHLEDALRSCLGK